MGTAQRGEAAAGPVKHYVRVDHNVAGNRAPMQT
jgi:hypothetical protein